jgi:hypothetical protein
MKNRNGQCVRALLAKVIAALLLAALPAMAQQSPAAPPTSQDPSKAEEKDKDNAGSRAAVSPQSGTSDDRLFYTLPNFLTLENAGQMPPLTTAENSR